MLAEMTTSEALVRELIEQATLQLDWVECLNRNELGDAELLCLCLLE